MLGNVCEWTLDHYNENFLANLPDNSANPVEPPNKAKYPKALRGGGFKGGLEVNSGWNWQPKNHGWPGNSAISVRFSAWVRALITMPDFSKRSM